MKDVLLMAAFSVLMGTLMVRTEDRVAEQGQEQERHRAATVEMVDELENKVIAVQKYCAEKKEEERAFCYYELMESPGSQGLKDAISLTCPRCKVDVEWDKNAR